MPEVLSEGGGDGFFAVKGELAEGGVVLSREVFVSDGWGLDWGRN
jgi:hypothetical protein